MPLTLDGNTGVQGNSGAFVAGTAVASTSGTSIDFTSIPSWVKRITVMFNGVSTNGSSNYLVQIGAGSVDTSGYTGYSKRLGTSGISSTSQITSGLMVFSGGTAAFPTIGTAVLTLVSSNSWVAQSFLGQTNNDDFAFGMTAKALSGALDRVRITTVNGTDAFDLGTINILYE
jgi:hypothetical protein